MNFFVTSYNHPIPQKSLIVPGLRNNQQKVRSYARITHKRSYSDL